MKKHIALLTLALLSAGILQVEAGGSLNFKGVSVAETLQVYSQFADINLVIDSGVTNQLKCITIDANPPTRKEAAKLLEKALREQADVVITPLDDKRASVKLVKK